MSSFRTNKNPPWARNASSGMTGMPAMQSGMGMQQQNMFQNSQYAGPQNQQLQLASQQQLALQQQQLASQQLANQQLASQQLANQQLASQQMANQQMAAMGVGGMSQEELMERKRNVRRERGYVHHVTDLRERGGRSSEWFKFILQISEEDYVCGIGFCPELHAKFRNADKNGFYCILERVKYAMKRTQHSCVELRVYDTSDIRVPPYSGRFKKIRAPLWILDELEHGERFDQARQEKNERKRGGRRDYDDYEEDYGYGDERDERDEREDRRYSRAPSYEFYDEAPILEYEEEEPRPRHEEKRTISVDRKSCDKFGYLSNIGPIEHPSRGPEYFNCDLQIAAEEFIPCVIHDPTHNWQKFVRLEEQDRFVKFENCKMVENRGQLWIYFYDYSRLEVVFECPDFDKLDAHVAYDPEWENQQDFLEEDMYLIEKIGDRREVRGGRKPQDQTTSGYIHNVSEMKTSADGRRYFLCDLQISETDFVRVNVYAPGMSMKFTSIAEDEHFVFLGKTEIIPMGDTYYIRFKKESYLRVLDNDRPFERSDGWEGYEDPNEPTTGYVRNVRRIELDRFRNRRFFTCELEVSTGKLINVEVFFLSKYNEFVQYEEEQCLVRFYKIRYWHSTEEGGKDIIHYKRSSYLKVLEDSYDQGQRQDCEKFYENDEEWSEEPRGRRSRDVSSNRQAEFRGFDDEHVDDRAARRDGGYDTREVHHSRRSVREEPMDDERYKDDRYQERERSWPRDDNRNAYDEGFEERDTYEGRGASWERTEQYSAEGDGYRTRPDRRDAREPLAKRGRYDERYDEREPVYEEDFDTADVEYHDYVEDYYDDYEAYPDDDRTGRDFDPFDETDEQFFGEDYHEEQEGYDQISEEDLAEAEELEFDEIPQPLFMKNVRTPEKASSGDYQVSRHFDSEEPPRSLPPPREERSVNRSYDRRQDDRRADRTSRDRPDRDRPDRGNRSLDGSTSDRGRRDDTSDRGRRDDRPTGDDRASFDRSSRSSRNEDRRKDEEPRRRPEPDSRGISRDSRNPPTRSSREDSRPRPRSPSRTSSYRSGSANDRGNDRRREEPPCSTNERDRSRTDSIRPDKRPDERKKPAARTTDRASDRKEEDRKKPATTDRKVDDRKKPAATDRKVEDRKNAETNEDSSDCKMEEVISTIAMELKGYIHNVGMPYRLRTERDDFFHCDYQISPNEKVRCTIFGRPKYDRFIEIDRRNLFTKMDYVKYYPNQYGGTDEVHFLNHSKITVIPEAAFEKKEIKTEKPDTTEKTEDSEKTEKSDKIEEKAAKTYEKVDPVYEHVSESQTDYISHRARMPGRDDRRRSDDRGTNRSTNRSRAWKDRRPDDPRPDGRDDRKKWDEKRTDTRRNVPEKADDRLTKRQEPPRKDRPEKTSPRQAVPTKEKPKEPERPKRKMDQSDREVEDLDGGCEPKAAHGFLHNVGEIKIPNHPKKDPFFYCELQVAGDKIFHVVCFRADQHTIFMDYEKKGVFIEFGNVKIQEKPKGTQILFLRHSVVNRSTGPRLFTKLNEEKTLLAFRRREVQAKAEKKETTKSRKPKEVDVPKLEKEPKGYIHRIGPVRTSKRQDSKPYFFCDLQITDQVVYEFTRVIVFDQTLHGYFQGLEKEDKFVHFKDVKIARKDLREVVLVTKNSKIMVVKEGGPFKKHVKKTVKKAETGKEGKGKQDSNNQSTPGAISVEGFIHGVGATLTDQTSGNFFFCDIQCGVNSFYRLMVCDPELHSRFTQVESFHLFIKIENASSCKDQSGNVIQVCSKSGFVILDREPHFKKRYDYRRTMDPREKDGGYGRSIERVDGRSTERADGRSTERADRNNKEMSRDRPQDRGDQRRDSGRYPSPRRGRSRSPRRSSPRRDDATQRRNTSPRRRSPRRESPRRSPRRDASPRRSSPQRNRNSPRRNASRRSRSPPRAASPRRRSPRRSPSPRPVRPVEGSKMNEFETMLALVEDPSIVYKPPDPLSRIRDAYGDGTHDEPQYQRTQPQYTAPGHSAPGHSGIRYSGPPMVRVGQVPQLPTAANPGYQYPTRAWPQYNQPYNR